MFVPVPMSLPGMRFHGRVATQSLVLRDLIGREDAGLLEMGFQMHTSKLGADRSDGCQGFRKRGDVNGLRLEQLIERSFGIDELSPESLGAGLHRSEQRFGFGALIG